jgi:acetoin utilization deacetylase AcuC-like enzyme
MKPLSKLHTEAIEKAKTDQAKVKAAALAMIETPMDMIKSILLRHEEAVIEVMSELHKQQQADEALLKQALEALDAYSWEQVSAASAAIKERLK